MTSSKKILIYHLASLGDILVALPALRIIRENYKHCQITMLTAKHDNPGAVDARQVLDGINVVDEYIYLNLNYDQIKMYRETFKEVRQGKYSVVIYLNEGRKIRQIIRDRFFFKLCGISEIIGAGLSAKLRNPIVDSAGNSESMRAFLVRKIKKIGSLNVDSFDVYGIKLKNITKHSWINERLSQKLIDNDRNKIISFSIGTKLEVKDWGNDRWIELIEKISSSYPKYLIVAIGGEYDKDKSDILFENVCANYINFCGALTIPQSAYILSRSKIFVCHDSGPMHLSAAIGVKTISIFSSRSAPGLWFPAGDNNKVFYTRIECEGCEKIRCISLKKRCIRAISVNEVFEELKSSIKLIDKGV
jgi:heptosyltransferase III